MLRHDLLQVRRTVAPTRDAIRRIVDHRIDIGEGPELLPRDIELDFADVHDKLLRATDGLDLSRDLLASATTTRPRSRMTRTTSPGGSSSLPR